MLASDRVLDIERHSRAMVLWKGQHFVGMSRSADKCTGMLVHMWKHLGESICIPDNERTDEEGKKKYANSAGFKILKALALQMVYMEGNNCLSEKSL